MMIGSDSGTLYKNRHEIQCRYMTHSAQSYVTSRLNKREIPIDSLQHWVVDSTIGYTVDLNQRGLFLHSILAGISKSASRSFVDTKKFTVSQLLDLSKLPSLILLDKYVNLKLAGKAELQGSVGLWGGKIRTATHSKIRYRGKRNIPKEVRDSTASLWSTIRPEFTELDNWFDHELEQRQSGDQIGQLRDTVIENRSIYSSGPIILGEGVVIKNSRIVAQKITIGSGVEIAHAQIVSKTDLIIDGDALLSGEFIARDSLYLNTSSHSKEQAFFYVHGHAVSKNRYKGTLHVEQYQGKGVFVSRGYQLTNAQSSVGVYLSKNASVEGLVYATSFANIMGSVTGTVICRNLKFKKGGTVWVGFLMDAKLAPGSGDLRVPWMFKSRSEYFFQEGSYVLH